MLDSFRQLALIMTFMTLGSLPDRNMKSCVEGISSGSVSPRDFLVWGSGLRSEVTLPYRYIFVQAVDTNKQNVTAPLKEGIQVRFFTGSKILSMKYSVFDRNNGSYIISYRITSITYPLEIRILWQEKDVGNSPYRLQGPVYAENCACPEKDMTSWFRHMQCPSGFSQIDADLENFPKVDMSKVKPEVIRRFVEGKSRSTSLVRYVIKDNQLYRQTHGEYVGFKMFSDNFILSLMRKVRLPDNEFYINLGDYPLEKQSSRDAVPIFSWCGSENTRDIVMPTYKVTESTLQSTGMPGASATVLSVQGNTGPAWEDKEDVAFWRGRDARRERLDLVRLARENPDVLDAGITHLFFYRNEPDITTETLVKPTNFYDFFKHKYQINMDGTVAAYRLPHLLAADSLVLKQDSQYYEHFYRDLKPFEHYVPVQRDLGDLLEQVAWARAHDDRAKRIAQNAQQFVNDNLLPEHIYCYYAILFKEYAARLTSPVVIDKELEKVEQPPSRCDCNLHKKLKKTEL